MQLGRSCAAQIAPEEWQNDFEHTYAWHAECVETAHNSMRADECLFQFDELCLKPEVWIDYCCIPQVEVDMDPETVRLNGALKEVSYSLGLKSLV